MQSSGHKRFFMQICRKLQKARHTQHQSIDVVQLSQLRVANSSMWNMVVEIRKTPRSAPALGIIKLMKYIPAFCLQNWWKPPRGQWWMSKAQVFITCVFFFKNWDATVHLLSVLPPVLLHVFWEVRKSQASIKKTPKTQLQYTTGPANSCCSWLAAL